MVLIDNSLINRVRELLFEKNARQFPRVYRKLYKGVSVDHITLEYRNERGRMSYFSVPQSAVRFATQRGAFRKFQKIETTEPVKYWGRNFKKWLYRGGNYTLQEIRQHAQDVSNSFVNQGKRGVISVSVRNWGGERGVWRSGKLKEFGQPIEFLQDYDGREEANNFTGFSIIWATQN